MLVYEFASGGGLAGREVPVSLVREGAAMRAALVADLAATRCHEIVTTTDARLHHSLGRGVDVVTLPDGDRARDAAIDDAIACVDAVWLIAPESDGCLERLAARVERQGKMLLGCCADAIRCASDKARLPQRLAAASVRHPHTRAIGRGDESAPVARDIGYPIVVKPSRGAGSDGVSLVRHARELPRAVAAALRVNRGPVLIQEYVPGTAASVSLVADGCRAVPLSLNAQHIGSRPMFEYRGGETPFEHPLAVCAIEAALDACRTLSGLRGYIGVDLVLAESAVYVIEVNPRLTTAYLGLRAAFEHNIAELALRACEGELPAAPLHARRPVRFTSSGRVECLREYAASS